MDLKKKTILFLTLIGIYTIYFITSTGMNTSNDGAHIGLAKSIYYEHDLSVEKYLNVYVNHPDYAVKNGKIYSDRLPGTAILILPTYAYANLISNLGVSVSNSNNEIDIVVSSILPPLLGMLSALMLFWYYFNILKKKYFISLLCTFIYAFGTLAWLESSHLFSHAPSLFFVSSAVLLAISNLQKSWQHKLIMISVLLGFATLIELQNFLYYLPILGYLIYKNNLLKKTHRFMLMKSVFFNLVILGVFICGLLFYNYLAFEDFTLKSNKYNPFFPEEMSFFTSLSGNILHGFDALYTSFMNLEAYINPLKARLNDIPGLFVTSPVLLLSSFGFILYYKRHKTEALLLLTCILIASLIAAMHVTTLVRHIYTINLLLFLPFIFSLEFVLKKSKTIKRNLMLIGISVLVLISLARVWFSTISYWGRNFDNIFLYREELKLFLISNIPLLLIVGVLSYKRNQQISVTEKPH